MRLMKTATGMPAAAKRREILGHLPVVGRVEHHAGRAGRPAPRHQRLLLADIVGRLGHVVDRAGAGLGGDPVGGPRAAS